MIIEDETSGVNKNCTIYIPNVQNSKRGAYLSCSRRLNTRLAEWMINAADFYVAYQFVSSAIHDKTPFSFIELTRTPEGRIAVNPDALKEMNGAAGLPWRYFEYVGEEELKRVLSWWYQEYKKEGGERNPIAEELLRENDSEGSDQDGIGDGYPRVAAEARDSDQASFYRRERRAPAPSHDEHPGNRHGFRGW